MIGFLLYSMTAAVVLFGYLLFDLMFHPLAAIVPSPMPGAIVLLAAALLNFWARRVAAGIGLLGAILLWRTCLGVLYAGIGLQLFWVFVIIPAFAVVALPLVLTSVYSLLSVAGLEQEMKLPKWLFPEDRKSGPIVGALGRHASRYVQLSRTAITGSAGKPVPPTVQLSCILLYAWWVVVFVSIASRFQPVPVEVGLPFWITQIAFLTALLWIVVAVSKGKNWARLALLIPFALSVWSARAHLVQSPRSRMDFAVVLIALALQGTALVLVFSKESASHFSQRRA